MLAVAGLFSSFLSEEESSHGRQEAGAGMELCPVSNGAVPLSIAPALHHLQVCLHLVEVLLEAGEQTVVLQ